MIPIERPAEPIALREQRAKRLPEFRATANKDPEGIDGYQCVRSALFAAQHHKCCYCEKATEEKHNHVEHYRPKSRYWWLAWTWDNLLYACEVCNELKGERFPLHGGVPLHAEESPPGTEIALLLNPAATGANPIGHIQFRFFQGQWRPFPRGGSRSGAETIRLCGLDRVDLLDLYRKHAISMEASLNALRRALADHDLAKVQALWHDLTQSFTSPGQPFTALSLDIMDQTIPKVQRDHYGLSLPSPGGA